MYHACYLLPFPTFLPFSHFNKPNVTISVYSHILCRLSFPPKLWKLNHACRTVDFSVRLIYHYKIVRNLTSSLTGQTRKIGKTEKNGWRSQLPSLGIALRSLLLILEALKAAEAHWHTRNHTKSLHSWEWRHSWMDSPSYNFCYNIVKKYQSNACHWCKIINVMHIM